MNKQQFLVVTGACILLFSLYFFGRTKPLAKQPLKNEASVQRPDFASILARAKSQLTPEQVSRLTALENSVVRGDVKNQKIAVYDQLASFWKDSVPAGWLNAYYLGEKAKLENLENSLTFAAHLFLRELRGDNDPAIRTWMANEAKDLFIKALSINPDNDSTKVGLGSCSFFGAAGGSSPMEGIQQIREVAERDTSNAFAQFMLGYGGIISGQFDKAAERFLKVVQLTPDDTEAVFLLAEAYEKMGEKAKAVEWYENGKKRVKSAELIHAINDKINSLK
ncbi:MAG: tetratricopeptide repeat protein [Chitinophagaceae bacterium]|nr:tetratricopeptide repeat protein [Chitinophagaceae bacterium]